MEQYSETEQAFEDDHTRQSGVSDGGMRVPGLEDHYSNPPTMSFIPFVRSYSILFSLELIHPCSRALPSLR